MGGGSSTRRVTFEADENENITVVKGVRLSDSVIDRMKEPSSPGGRPQSQHRSGSGTGALYIGTESVIINFPWDVFDLNVSKAAVALPDGGVELVVPNKLVHVLGGTRTALLDQMDGLDPLMVCPYQVQQRKKQENIH